MTFETLAMTVRIIDRMSVHRWGPVVEARKEIFRFDTFGDEQFWTDTLRMHELIETSVSPRLAGTEHTSEARVGRRRNQDGAARAAQEARRDTTGEVPLDPRCRL